MIKVHYSNPDIEGMTREEQAAMREVATDPLRVAEIFSIRQFLENNCRPFLSGRVLDYGAGKVGTCRQPEPYRDLVKGQYVPVDKGDIIPPGPYDALLCTQVAQYFADPRGTFHRFRKILGGGAPGEPGYLILTYPTNWPEVEPGDLVRFTGAGMQTLLEDVGFAVRINEARAALQVGANTFVTGYGLVATTK